MFIGAISGLSTSNVIVWPETVHVIPAPPAISNDCVKRSTVELPLSATIPNEVEIDGVELKLRRIDPADMLMISDTEPGTDDTLSTAMNINQQGQ